MKRLITILMSGLLVIIAHPNHATADQQSVPSTAGGFTLNRSIEHYNLEKYSHYVKEVIVTDVEGFRKGFITYGTCENPGKIVRIKLKYEDRSYEFFEKLLDRYKQQFGKKPKFSGDRFGNVKSWKWTFVNKDNHRVSLTLQHNLKDSDESIGNTVKLSLPDQITAERECFNNIHSKNSSKRTQSAESNWEEYIPR